MKIMILTYLVAAAIIFALIYIVFDLWRARRERTQTAFGRIAPVPPENAPAEERPSTAQAPGLMAVCAMIGAEILMMAALCILVAVAVGAEKWQAQALLVVGILILAFALYRIWLRRLRTPA